MLVDQDQVLQDTRRLAAFAAGSTGGNPAGVWIGSSFPPDAVMQEVAARVGYSETAFAVPVEPGRVAVRYFSPVGEIAFCGHATIALASQLFGSAAQETVIGVDTRAGRIALRHDAGKFWFATVAARIADAPAEWLDDVLAVFGWSRAQLDPVYPPMLAFAGNWHLVVALADAKDLQGMRYDMDRLIPLAAAQQLATLQLVHRVSDGVFLSRNPFPAGHIYEDPATGAAAAAFAGYLQLRGAYPASGQLELRQGDAMGVPCRLGVQADAQETLWVGGTARLL